MTYTIQLLVESFIWSCILFMTVTIAGLSILGIVALFESKQWQLNALGWFCVLWFIILMAYVSGGIK